VTKLLKVKKGQDYAGEGTNPFKEREREKEERRLTALKSPLLQGVLNTIFSPPFTYMTRLEKDAF
jgi:hypothetical protein